MAVGGGDSGGGDGAGGGGGGAAVGTPWAGVEPEALFEDGVGIGDGRNIHHLLKREPGQVGVIG